MIASSPIRNGVAVSNGNPNPSAIPTSNSHPINFALRPGATAIASSPVNSKFRHWDFLGYLGVSSFVIFRAEKGVSVEWRELWARCQRGDRVECGGKRRMSATPLWEKTPAFPCCIPPTQSAVVGRSSLCRRTPHLGDPRACPRGLGSEGQWPEPCQLSFLNDEAHKYPNTQAMTNP